MQTLRTILRGLRPAYRVLTAPKPRKFEALQADTSADCSSSSPSSSPSSDPETEAVVAIVVSAGSTNTTWKDLKTKVGSFNEQLRKCTEEASDGCISADHLTEFVVCFHNIAAVHRRAAKVTAQLQVTATVGTSSAARVYALVALLVVDRQPQLWSLN